jgi:hypothetical protein
MLATIQSKTFLSSGLLPKNENILICDTIILPLVMYKKNSMVWVRERTIPTERPPLVGEVIANFCVTDSYGRIHGFLDRSRYFSIK